MTSPDPRPSRVADLYAERARLDAELNALMEQQEAEANGVFGKNLRRLREAKGWTQQELSDRVGLSRPSVANMEAGKQATPWPKLCLLADVLDVPLDEFRTRP